MDVPQLPSQGGYGNKRKPLTILGILTKVNEALGKQKSERNAPVELDEDPPFTHVSDFAIRLRFRVHLDG